MTSDRVVLVHGSMQCSQCWEEVLPHLQCDAVAVDLPGRPGAPQLPVTLDGWADTVLEATVGHSLIVAHSLGGLATLTAATRCPERISGIVFVAAVIPSSGQCY